MHTAATEEAAGTVLTLQDFTFEGQSASLTVATEDNFIKRASDRRPADRLQGHRVEPYHPLRTRLHHRRPTTSTSRKLSCQQPARMANQRLQPVLWVRIFGTASRTHQGRGCARVAVCGELG
eukprot:5432218-Prymnesium_polylepis.1